MRWMAEMSAFELYVGRYSGDSNSQSFEKGFSNELLRLYLSYLDHENVSTIVSLPQIPLTPGGDMSCGVLERGRREPRHRLVARHNKYIPNSYPTPIVQEAPDGMKQFPILRKSARNS